MPTYLRLHELRVDQSVYRGDPMTRDLVAHLLEHGLAPDATSDSIAERVYQDLRDDLLFGRISLGDRLVEEHLAEHFECSRTPVREALAPAAGRRPRRQAPDGRDHASAAAGHRAQGALRAARRDRGPRRPADRQRRGQDQRRRPARGVGRAARSRLDASATRSRLPTSSTPMKPSTRASPQQPATSRPRATCATSTSGSGSCASTTSRPRTASPRRSTSTSN